MVAMKSSIAEVMWKRMIKAKIINMADGGTENQKQENLEGKTKIQECYRKILLNEYKAETEKRNCCFLLLLVGKSPCAHFNNL